MLKKSLAALAGVLVLCGSLASPNLALAQDGLGFAIVDYSCYSNSDGSGGCFFLWSDGRVTLNTWPAPREVIMV